MRIKNAVPYHELHAINASQIKTKMHWFQEENEFRLDGKMYDIVQVETKGAETIYYCIDDVAEERLFANLDNLVKENLADEQSKHSKAAKNLHKSFSQIYIKSKNLTVPCISTEVQAAYSAYQKNALGYTPEKLTPPPQGIS